MGDRRQTRKPSRYVDQLSRSGWSTQPGHPCMLSQSRRVKLVWLRAKEKVTSAVVCASEGKDCVTLRILDIFVACLLAFVLGYPQVLSLQQSVAVFSPIPKCTS